MMQDKNKMTLLLSLVVVLAGVKFGLLPVLDWQADKLEQIDSIERRNEKAQRLLDQQQAIFMQLASTGKQYKQTAEAFPVYPESATFRLQSQVMFEQILKQDELSTRRFFWRSDTDTQVQGNLHKAAFNASVYGSAKNFVMLQSKLAHQYPDYRMTNMSLNLSNYNEKSLGRVNVTFTVESYYWKGSIN